MRKIISILFICCFSVIIFGQNQSYSGFYQTRFFNFFGEVKVIEAEFEVKNDNAIVGQLKIGKETKILQGKVDSKGKFEAQTVVENGSNILIKGQFPVTKNEGKVSLVMRTVEKGKGSKSVSESGINGFIKQISAPVEQIDSPFGFADVGKTSLWIESKKPLFDKEWTDIPATVKRAGTADFPAFEVEVNVKTEEMQRRFRFRIIVKQDGQKVWDGKDIAFSTYAESKKLADGKSDINLFTGIAGNVLGGKVEIINENETTMIFKINNLKIKAYNEDVVTINGFIHAQKTTNPAV